MSCTVILNNIEEAARTSSADLSSALSDFTSTLDSADMQWSFKDLERLINTSLESACLDTNCLITLSELCSFDDVRFLLMRGLLKKLQNVQGSLAISFSDLLHFMDNLEIVAENNSKGDCEVKEDEQEDASSNLLSYLAKDQHHPAKNKKYHSSLFEKLVLWLQENASEDKHLQKFLMYSTNFQDNMLRPFLLGDFYTKCVKAGGSNAVYALQGITKLMQLHNFEYPDFYTDLYALILTENFASKKVCDAFATSLDLALSSTHVAQCTVASFVKKLSRIAVFATPDVAVIILAIVYNALVRHEACRVLVDKKSAAASAENCNSDPFKVDVADPLYTNAINSSLWELSALQRHWHPHVAKSAARFNVRLVKIEEKVEQIADNSSLYALRHACRSVKENSRIFSKGFTTARLNLEPPADKNFFLAPFCRV